MPNEITWPIHAVYLPPITGLPFLAVRLADGQADAVPFPSSTKASEYNSRRNLHPGSGELHPTSNLCHRVLREALRELREAKGDEALDRFLERARLVLTIDIPNIPRAQDELNKRAFDDVQRDVDRVRANPEPDQMLLDDTIPGTPPPRSR